KFEAGDFDGAAVLFQKSLDNAGSVALVRSAAMHGLASVKIEKADYSAAAGLLEKYISEFGKRTGDKEDRYQKEEPQDEVPMVADAMWKLTLVYQQLGANDKAKNTAERIIEVYGDNQQYADKAKKFVAAL
ncbi:MAG: tetratricopeptide repeat protein, partial [Fibrobacter sp.]|nr:tetratricopeptide repeat protein [Fibrobacter sp.]